MMFVYNVYIFVYHMFIIFVYIFKQITLLVEFRIGLVKGQWISSAIAGQVNALIDAVKRNDTLEDSTERRSQ